MARGQRSLSVEELRRRITVRARSVQRDGSRQQPLWRWGGDPSDDAVRGAAVNAGAGAFIERLPDGYENLLGHWFEKGAELSVGEWQRVALARAFLRQAPVIVLDEPTSAMDPWAETDWLRRLRSLAKGRTAVLITHRFTTAMLADEIHVMEEGRLVESGSHPELIARGGRYAEWWATQSFQ